MNDLKEIGLAAAVAVIILREVFKFLGPYLARWRNGNGKKPDNPGNPGNGVLAQVTQVHTKVDKALTFCRQIHEMHDRVDQDGVPLWYVPRSLEASIRELKGSVDRLTAVVERRQSP